MPPKKLLVRASKLGPTHSSGQVLKCLKRNGTYYLAHIQKIVESFVLPYKIPWQLTVIPHGSPSLEARTSEGFRSFQYNFECSNKKNR